MPAFLKLIRFPNLIIVGLTQFLIYQCVFNQMVGQVYITAALPPIYYILITIITILIAAGGYIINDIIDLEMDLVNKPEKVIVGKSISKKQAKQTYIGTIIFGFILALYVAIQTHNLPLLVVYPIAVILLYFYSTFFKKLPFLGNIIVALFCAFVPGVLLLAERSQLNMDLFDETVYPVTIVYMVFAFLSTLIREVVKDMEDIEGDRLYGCQTIPIFYSISFAKDWALMFAYLLLVGIGYIIKSSFVGINIRIGMGILLMIPLIIIILKLYQAEQKADYSFISQTVKVLMLFGLFFLLAI